MDSGRHGNNLGEVSFSCYLGTAEDKFIQKLTESVQYPHHSISLSPEEEFPSSIGLETSKSGAAEIGVFGAEKYYNMKLDDGPIIIDTASNHGEHRKSNKVELLRNKTKSRPGTPSVNSDTSWNSQSALLPIYQRNISQQRKQKKAHGKRFFSGLSCHGSCSDKRSVYTNPNAKHEGATRGKDYRKEAIQITHSSTMLDGRKQHQPRFKVKDEKDEFIHKPSSEKMSTTTESNKEQFFPFPVAKADLQNLVVKRQLEKEDVMGEEESRMSLEVFGSHTLNKDVIAMNLERKLSMLTWDAIPKTPNLPTSSVRSQVFDDVESDASSDLFEIENISGSGVMPLFTRQTSDGMSGCMTPTPYAPSETSIEWSVVTASAADFSAMSDYEERKLTEINTKNLGSTAAVSTKVAKTKSIVDQKDVQSGLSSKLLGCKSHKAVRVAEDAYRTNEKAKSHHQQPQRAVAPMPVRKLQAEGGERF